MRALISVALGVAVLAAPAAGAAPRPAGNPTVFADCLGKPQVRPAEIILACGDGNASVGSITWTGWGSAFTAGRGTASINDCTPSCVAGRDHFYPVLVLLTGKQTCRPGGQIAYLTLTMTFLDKSPHTAATQPFPCRPLK